MNIALLADPRKNDLLVNFCLAYSAALRPHQLVSFFTSARHLKQTVHLKIQPLVGNLNAGLDQLASRAWYNELDAVIYLRDPQSPDYLASYALQQACDRNSIPFASNLASAEILVRALQEGDLDYRENYREQKRKGSPLFFQF